MANKSRTLIKLDDKIIEITQGEKGLEAKELSQDDQFEVGILGEGIECLIQNDMNRITNQAYEELKQDFKNNLKANVLGIVGFEKKWGNVWEVDHCNGRSSTVTQYIAGRLQQMIHAEMDKLVNSTELGEILKETKKGLKKELQEQFSRYVRNETYNAAATEAKAFLTDAMKKAVKKYQTQAIKKVEVALLGRTKTDKLDD